jgi:septal ring-binding cell division protein DamX
MRKLILIATVSLLATQAYAGGPRSLSLAATNASQPATEQPATAAAPQAPPAAPPANVQTATTTPASAPAVAPAPTTAAPVAGTTEAAKPKHRQSSTEARVIRELHRHGIYW